MLYSVMLNLSGNIPVNLTGPTDDMQTDFTLTRI
jgi:hypothetical protein